MGTCQGPAHTRTGRFHAVMLPNCLECRVDEDLGSWTLALELHAGRNSSCRSSDGRQWHSKPEIGMLRWLSLETLWDVFATATAIAAACSACFREECKLGVRLLPLTSREGRGILLPHRAASSKQPRIGGQ